MSRLKRLIAEIHRRSLWQVLLIYVGGALVAYQAIQALTEGLGLPQWFPALALILFIVGLPIVLATAFVQEGGPSLGRSDPTLFPDAEGTDGAVRAEVGIHHHVFTWRNAIMVGVAALALWGVVATGWIVLYGGATGTASVESKSVAVLPFANIGGIPENEYFSDGITGEIIAHLSKIADLKVISRTSVMQYKNTQKSVRQIGGELDVATILEGELQRAGDRIRINAQLINAKDEGHLWSEQYDRELTDVFAIQSDVAEKIAEALRATLTPEEEERIEQPLTSDLEAYELYLRGNEYLHGSEQRDDFIEAVKLYTRAIELDPSFAVAHARLSEIHSAMWWYHYDRTQQRLAMAKAAVDKALTLNPQLPEAHRALGTYHYSGYLDYDRALEEFAVALTGLPNDGHLMLGIGAVYRRQGDMEQALVYFKKGAELDPRGFGFYSVSETYRLLHNYRDAIRYADLALATANPSHASGNYREKIEAILGNDGNIDRARHVLVDARDAGVRVPEGTQFNFHIVDRDYQAALDLLAALDADAIEGQRWYRPKALLYAQIYGLMGESDLEAAYYDSARTVLEHLINEHPEDSRLHSSLGMAYAGLGLSEDAVREGKRGVELLPIAKEAWRGSTRVIDLARIYAMVGQHDAAIDELELLLSIPSEISVPLLRIDPPWDPLRSHTRFQALLERYADN